MVDGNCKAYTSGGGGELSCILEVECNKWRYLMQGKGARIVGSIMSFSGELLTPVNHDSDFLRLGLFRDLVDFTNG